jgi:EAL and modified HD-GYP domain-containing signal transduction protein
MQDIFIGRQPIYNEQLGVYAYELLFRSGVGEARIDDGDTATSQVIINAFNDIGIDRLVGDRKAAINITERLLDDSEQLPLDPQRVIFDLPRTFTLTRERVEVIKRLRAKGYVIALDDFTYADHLKPLVALADIIKIDTGPMRVPDLETHVRKLRRFGKALLAEGVENMREFEYLRDIGFTYYQGYFLSKPRIVKSKALPTNRLAVMQLLSVLHDPDSEMSAVEAAISQDVTLGYKLIKLMNSAFFGLSREIDSVKRAVVLLGRKKLASWASMLALTSLNDRPLEAVRLALIRAKMCERLAEAARLTGTEHFFTVGLFSALDLLMERDLAAIIQPLPLTADIKAALLEGKGHFGQALTCVKAYESADWPHVNFLGLSQFQITQAYLDAGEWAEQVVGSVA